MSEHEPEEDLHRENDELPPFTMEELKILLRHQRDTMMDYKHQSNMATDSEQRLRAELTEAKTSQETSDLKASRALNLTKIFQGKSNLAKRTLTSGTPWTASNHKANEPSTLSDRNFCRPGYATTPISSLLSNS